MTGVDDANNLIHRRKSQSLWLEWWTPVPFNIVPGTVTLNGNPFADPSGTFDWVSNRDLNRWSFMPHGLTVDPDHPLEFKFRATATLTPGIFYVGSHVKMRNDPNLGSTSSKSAGETAPVIARREYNIEASHLGHTVDVELAPGPTSTNIIAWTEH